jgi:hypothetical protein
MMAQRDRSPSLSHAAAMLLSGRLDRWSCLAFCTTTAAARRAVAQSPPRPQLFRCVVRLTSDREKHRVLLHHPMRHHLDRISCTPSDLAACLEAARSTGQPELRWRISLACSAFRRNVAALHQVAARLGRLANVRSLSLVQESSEGDEHEDIASAMASVECFARSVGQGWRRLEEIVLTGGLLTQSPYFGLFVKHALAPLPCLATLQIENALFDSPEPLEHVASLLSRAESTLVVLEVEVYSQYGDVDESDWDQGMGASDAEGSEEEQEDDMNADTVDSVDDDDPLHRALLTGLASLALAARRSETLTSLTLRSSLDGCGLTVLGPELAAAVTSARLTKLQLDRFAFDESLVDAAPFATSLRDLSVVFTWPSEDRAEILTILRSIVLFPGLRALEIVSDYYEGNTESEEQRREIQSLLQQWASSPSARNIERLTLQNYLMDRLLDCETEGLRPTHVACSEGPLLPMIERLVAHFGDSARSMKLIMPNQWTLNASALLATSLDTLHLTFDPTRNMGPRPQVAPLFASGSRLRHLELRDVHFMADVESWLTEDCMLETLTLSLLPLYGERVEAVGPSTLQQAVRSCGRPPHLRSVAFTWEGRIVTRVSDPDRAILRETVSLSRSLRCVSMWINGIEHRKQWVRNARGQMALVEL